MKLINKDICHFFRGGQWRSVTEICRITHRSYDKANYKYCTTNFRLFIYI